ncbi:MAG: hypothetical protein VYD64_07025 [Pseudomonadota bacterium]|nr:hypothetical protein [Pseudomonadota bacterium]
MVGQFIRVAVLALCLAGMAVSAHAAKYKTIEALRERVVAEMRQSQAFASVRASRRGPGIVEITTRRGVRLTSDLRDIYTYLKAFPDEPSDAVIARFIRGVIDGRKDHSGNGNLVVANLRTLNNVRNADTQSVGGVSRVLHERFVGDLVVVYQYDLPDSLEYVGTDDFRGRRSLRALRRIGVAKLAKWLPKLAEEPIGSHRLYYVAGNPMLTPGLLLVDGFRRKLDKQFPKGALIIVPRRDQLFAFDRRVPDAAQHARLMVEATISDKYALMSRRIYLWSNGKLRVFDG